MRADRASTPRVSLGLFPTDPAGRMVELIGLAEDLGFDRVWIGDSQNIWREAYTTLGAAAQATERIGLGTGVTNAVTRHLSVLASAWSTLAELAPGRVTIGVGTGDSSLRTMGMRPLPVDELERRITTLKSLLQGQPVDSERGGKYSLQFAGAPVSIYVAAAARRSLRMAGRTGDGVIACVGTDPRLVTAAREHVDEGLADAGRDRSDTEFVLWTALAIDEDGTKARDSVRAFTASAVVPPTAANLGAAQRSAIERIREEYDYSSHMKREAEHRELVPDDLVDLFTVAGTPAECREQLLGLFDLPIDEVALVPFPLPRTDRGELLGRLRSEVLDQLPFSDDRKESMR